MINVRDLSTHRNGIVDQHIIPLGPRRPMVLNPDPNGSPVKIELDLALEIPDDTVAVLTVDPHLLELGLVPALGVDFITSLRPVRALNLWVFPPKVAVALDPGTTLATLIFLHMAMPRGVYDDPHLNIGERDDRDEDRDIPFLFLDDDGLT